MITTIWCVVYFSGWLIVPAVAHWKASPVDKDDEDFYPFLIFATIFWPVAIAIVVCIGVGYLVFKAIPLAIIRVLNRPKSRSLKRGEWLQPDSLIEPPDWR